MLFGAIVSASTHLHVFSVRTLHFETRLKMRGFKRSLRFSL